MLLFSTMTGKIFSQILISIPKLNFHENLTNLFIDFVPNKLVMLMIGALLADRKNKLSKCKSKLYKQYIKWIALERRVRET